MNILVIVLLVALALVGALLYMAEVMAEAVDKAIREAFLDITEEDLYTDAAAEMFLPEYVKYLRDPVADAEVEIKKNVAGLRDAS